MERSFFLQRPAYYAANLPNERIKIAFNAVTDSEVVPIAVCSKASQELLLFQRVVDTLEFSIGSPRKKRK